MIQKHKNISCFKSICQINLDHWRIDYIRLNNKEINCNISMITTTLMKSRY